MKYLYPNVLLVSHPKSGRTWLRMIMANILKLQGKWNPKQEMFFCRHWRAREMEMFYYFTIYLTRNCADTMVSYYFERSKRVKHKFKGTISEFLRDPKFGVKQWNQFDMDWREVKPKLIISYEQLHKDTSGTVKKVLDCFGYKAQDSVIERAVEASKFDKMKKIEENGGGLIAQYRGRFGRNFDKSDKESYRCRNGCVGDYIDYLSEEDILYIEKETRNAVI